jgi:hypothetical protein
MSILDLRKPDTIKEQKNNNNFIYREFEKKNNEFIATSKFFISEEINDKIEFSVINIIDKNKTNQKIIPYENDNKIYILTNNNNNNNNITNKYLYNKYIDLILISNISFSIDELNINKKEILNKYLKNDTTIDEKILEDLYYNKDFSKKINIELPKKYGNKKYILEDIEICKKYLFKIKFTELPLNINNNYQNCENYQHYKNYKNKELIL